jgi:DNA-binding MarR family transcriptional regulator
VVFYFSGHQHDPAGWVKALAMERETYKRRAKYQRRGVLGDLGIALLQLLLNLGRKYGKIFQDYGTLAVLLRKDPEAVVEAMKRLIAHGFVTKHRRSKLIGTPQGQRRVQDSNAYEVHMPEQGLAALPLVAAQPSGSEKPVVSVLQDRGDQKADRFWLAEPWRMADGSYY